MPFKKANVVPRSSEDSRKQVYQRREPLIDSAKLLTLPILT